MNDNLDKLADYVRDEMSKGYEKAEIEKTLLSKGWTNAEIKKAFRKAESKTRECSLQNQGKGSYRKIIFYMNLCATIFIVVMIAWMSYDARMSNGWLEKEIKPVVDEWADVKIPLLESIDNEILGMVNTDMDEECEIERIYNAGDYLEGMEYKDIISDAGKTYCRFAYPDNPHEGILFEKESKLLLSYDISVSTNQVVLDKITTLVAK